MCACRLACHHHRGVSDPGGRENRQWQEQSGQHHHWRPSFPCRERRLQNNGTHRSLDRLIGAEDQGRPISTNDKLFKTKNYQPVPSFCLTSLFVRLYVCISACVRLSLTLILDPFSVSHSASVIVHAAARTCVRACVRVYK